LQPYEAQPAEQYYTKIYCQEKAKMINKKILNISGLFIASTSVFLILLFLYRVEVFFLIKEIYPQFSNISFFSYLSISAFPDAVITLFFCIIFYFISLTGYFSRNGAAAISATILSALHLFLLQGVNFFRIYETAFSRKFWASEITTGMSEIIGSAISETPALFYIKAIAGLAVIIIVIAKAPRLIEETLLKKPAISWAFPALITALMITLSGIALLPAPFSGEADSKSNALLFREISGNPIYNLFRTDDKTENSIISGISSEGEFKFGLNTESIVNRLMHKRINSIPRGRKYNIIFYFFESAPMKYFNMEIYGEKLLPNWHRLKKNSLFMKNHYANFPLSANAMLSVFTSAYSHHSKDLVIQKYSSVKLKSISEILKDEGYTTAVVHTGDLRYAGQRRFLSYRAIDRIIDLPELEKIPPYNIKVGWGVDERAMTAPSVEFLKNRGESPFFITYFPANPHHPYAIPEGFKQITGPVPSGIDYKKRNWLNYLNSMHYADYCLGELIDTLEKEGLMENTILFLFADHGEAFYQHPQNYNHPFFLYEENVHVPFLIYNRDLFPEPLIYNGISSHVDIPVTVIDILGIKKDEKHEGKSILSAHMEELAFLHTYWKDDYTGVRDGKWKYIRRMDNAMEELYNLETDPDEIKNIKDNHPELAEKFRSFILNSRDYQIKFYEKILSHQ